METEVLDGGARPFAEGGGNEILASSASAWSAAYLDFLSSNSSLKTPIGYAISAVKTA